MIGQKFKLRFHEPFSIRNKVVTGGVFDRYIDEPVGMDRVPFVLKEKSKGYARDVFFGGDSSNEFSFFKFSNHEFEEILYQWNTYGWQAKIQLISEFDEVDTIVGDFSMQHLKTDQLEEIKVRIVQDSDEAQVKRMQDINVNLLEDGAVKDSIRADNSLIQKVELIDVLIKSKPVTFISSWKPTDLVAFTGTVTGFRTNYQNAFNQVNESDINSTLSFIDRVLIRNRSDVGIPRGLENMKIIEAVDNITNAKIRIKNLRLSYYIAEQSSFGNVRPHMRYCIGTDDNISQIASGFVEMTYSKTFVGIRDTSPFDGTLTGNAQRHDLDFDEIEAEIGNIPRGFSLYIVFDTSRLFNYVQWDSEHGELEVVATTTAYNTVSPAIRLIDAVKKTVGSISGLETNFPEIDSRSDLYNQMIFNGNFLRNIIDRPFNLSFKDIISGISELNVDYEVYDGTVNFLRYRDFYTNTEIAYYGDVRFDSYEKSMSQNYAINEFVFKYRKFQSQKEGEEANTFDIVNGESQCLIANDYVENKKEVTVSFVRDTFMIDDQRRKSFDLNARTSTQDDETIYLIDCVSTNSNGATIEFTETDNLEHKVDTETGNLRVSNKGSLDWSLLGINVGDRFDILDDPNAGFYSINKIEGSTLELSFATRLRSNRNDGIRLTRFTYYVTGVDYMTRSNEGFDEISGVSDASGFANLDFTIKRNIVNYWNEYLAACNLYADSPIKFTRYQNNGDLKLVKDGLTTIENEEFTPTNPLIKPIEHKITIIMKFDEFMSLAKKTRAERGFIRTNDAKGHPLRLFPKEMSFVNKGDCGELSFTGYEKYSDGVIKIINGGKINYILINGETRINKLKYTVDEREISLRDEQGLLLYPPVFWNKISYNGSVAESQQQLEEWLQQLS